MYVYLESGSLFIGRLRTPSSCSSLGYLGLEILVGLDHGLAPAAGLRHLHQRVEAGGRQPGVDPPQQPHQVPDNVVDVDTSEEELIKHRSAEVFGFKLFFHPNKSSHQTMQKSILK